MTALSLRLPEELETRLAQEARREGVARSEVARTAIAEFLQRKERERIIGAFVAEARAAYGDPKIRRDAIDLAEEALPLDNQGLQVAEGADRPAPRPSRRGKRGT